MKNYDPTKPSKYILHRTLIRVIYTAGEWADIFLMVDLID